jgi:uncharacterized membrane protein
MAGLFYIVRLFIYHTEAQQKPEAERKILSAQFEVMESKLMNIITTPAMILTLLAGIAMVYINPYLLTQSWLIIKLCFVVGLVIYHIICHLHLDIHTAPLMERGGYPVFVCHCVSGGFAQCLKLDLRRGGFGSLRRDFDDGR